MTIVRQIKAFGNGAMIPVHKADMEKLGVSVGATVRVTLDSASEPYQRTRASAKRMAGRWSRTLQKLGE